MESTFAAETVVLTADFSRGRRESVAKTGNTYWNGGGEYMSKYNLGFMSDMEFEKQFDESGKLGEEFLRTAPKAVSARFDAPTRRVFFEMDTGVTFFIPVDLIQGLQTDDIEALEDFELVQHGVQIHWNTLDAQFYVGSLLNGEFGTQKWMSNLSEHLSVIGKKGGSSRSPAKRAASAENGKKGGRPRRTKVNA
jgi:hypothetical protein